MALLSDSKNIICDFIDYNRNQTVTILNIANGLFKTLTPFCQLPQSTTGESRDTILGFECNYTVISSFSNKIELCYTDKADAKGSPYRNYLPSGNSLVLKVTINGNRTLRAVSIENVSDRNRPDYPFDAALEVTAPEMIEVSIDQGADENGSFSHLSVSGVLAGNKE